MAYLLRVRLVSFLAGAGTASFAGFYLIYKDYKLAHDSISAQMKRLHDSLDERVSALEKLKETESPQHMEAAE